MGKVTEHKEDGYGDGYGVCPVCDTVISIEDMDTVDVVYECDECGEVYLSEAEAEECCEEEEDEEESK